MLDALSFGLFGKAHRPINKPQLINTINNKECLVEVEFEIGKNKYFVRRGMKPGIFEIIVNGQLMNQSSHSKDYQKILEQNILKLNHKSFHQIVVLGSSSFVPFMQLPQGSRRGVIEDLLDINVFSKMNALLKEKNGDLKERLKDIEHEVDIIETKRESQRKYIRDLTKLNAEYKKEKVEKISSLRGEVKTLQESNEADLATIKKKKPIVEKSMNGLHDKKHTVQIALTEINTHVKQVVKSAKFYDNNDNCPTCKQDLDEETKKSAITLLKESARGYDSRRKELLAEEKRVNKEISALNKIFEEVNALQNSVNSNLKQISVYQKSIQSLEDDISAMSNDKGDLSEARMELVKLDTQREQKVEEKFTHSEQYSYNNVMIEMLKDTGIKTKVIKQYIPVINKLVNQYLQVLDFFVLFHLDDQFSEELKSRHRDTFSYSSFSEGEKQRIDLALLFTWRQVAKMKNSVATNLLVLDETFDSSLDHDGVENLMKILYTLSDDTNVFVISHKGEILEGKFEKKIQFMKEKNFSVKKDM